MKDFSPVTADDIVSIPYGSIKRIKNQLKNAGLSMFQFLMVRLKGGFPLFFLFGLYLFQFLMVRLKANLTAGLRGAGIAFQFLMVRLKANLTAGLRGAGIAFQFLMVRLKVVFPYICSFCNICFNSLWFD